MGFLRYDSDFMLFISRLADLAWLNILCFVCSLPILTSGAAMSAKYYVAMKLERGESVKVTKAFFHSFKQNFFQNTWVTFILLLIVGFFGFDWWLVILNGTQVMSPILIGLLGIFSVMLALIIFSIFPLLSRFTMGTFAAFRNALIFGIVHLPRVVIGFAVVISPYIISIWYYKWAWLIWLGIESMALYYNAIFFIKKFEILEEKTFGTVANPYRTQKEIEEEELKPLFEEEGEASEAEDDSENVEVEKTGENSDKSADAASGKKTGEVGTKDENKSSEGENREEKQSEKKPSENRNKNSNGGNKNGNKNSNGGNKNGNKNSNGGNKNGNKNGNGGNKNGNKNGNGGNKAGNKNGNGANKNGNGGNKKGNAAGKSTKSVEMR